MSDQRIHLIEGLVGPNNTRLYHHNPAFHAAIHTLAQMLPPMIDGLAESCRASQSQVDDITNRLSKGLLDRPDVLLCGNEMADRMESLAGTPGRALKRSERTDLAARSGW